MASTLIVLGIVLAFLAFFFFGGCRSDHEPTVRRRPDDGIDHAELEQAEREARDATDEDEVRDWGPGAGGSGEGGSGKGEG